MIEEQENRIEIKVWDDPCYICRQRDTHHCNGCEDLEDFEWLPKRSHIVEILAQAGYEMFACKDWEQISKKEKKECIAKSKRLLAYLIAKCKGE